MNQNNKHKHNSLIYKLLDNKPINEWRRKFIAEVLWLFLSIKGRVNFVQLGRYGDYCEQRYRQQFEKEFDFLDFNMDIVHDHCSDDLVLAFDPSYIPKSGKKTAHLGNFWSGCANKAKLGLEIGGIAAIDIENHTAMHLEAIQTPSVPELKDKSMTLVQWYAKLFIERVSKLHQISKTLVADAYFSKITFVDPIVQAGYHLVSRLRDDANLRYLYTGPKTGKQGKPKQYAGKIKYKELDLNYFELIEQNDDYSLYSAVVNSVSLKRNIKIVIMVKNNAAKTHKIYFSTDIQMSGKRLFNIYTKRFQIEFVYRDAKGYTGLNHCQARDEEKLNFHFNASLTSINIAKAAHWLSIPKEDRGSFSMADIKTMNHNTLLLEKVIHMFAINPNTRKNKKIIKELIHYGKIAA